MKKICGPQTLIVSLLILSGFSLRAQQVIDKIMQQQPAFPSQLIWKDQPEGKFLEPGLFSHTKPLFELYNESTHQYIGTKKGNLYVRDPDTLIVISQPQTDWHWSMDGALWSPDGKYLAAKQINDNEVPLIELVLQMRTSNKHYTRAGEALPKHQFYLINIQTGELKMIDHGMDWPYIHVLSWSEDCKTLRFLQADRLLKNMRMFSVDIESGETKQILADNSDTYLIGLNLLQGYSNRLLEMNLFWFLDFKQQFIYTSEKSGYSQLYLYNMEGELIRPLTEFTKNGIVHKLLNVDTESGWAYYTASSDQKQPYNVQIFRASLNEKKIEKIIEGDNILEVHFSKSKDSLLVFQNRLPDFMQIDYYSSSGKLIANVWKADLSPLEELGFQPEYVQTRATDKATLLEAMILKPLGFNPETKYPVVEYIYGGPNSAIVPRDFFDRSMWNMQNLANKGFIVVFIDGRGTPYRGKQFQDFSYGKFGQLEIEEHTAVLKQLGASRPYMNLDKVGVIGHSWGGYFALKALIEAPDFYKVGHVNAAGLDPNDFRVAIEPFMGCLPAECPDKYEKAAVTNKLNQLKAPLMIVHGTADDDVPITESYKLVEALEAIGYKKYKFDEYQGFDHIVMRNRQWESEMIAFFVDELMAK